MLFLGMANAYIMRTNMSVAIVAMVNHTALPKDDTVLDDECDSDNSSNSWVAEMSKHSQVVRTQRLHAYSITVLLKQHCRGMNFLAFAHADFMLCL
jgi:hypothetical protein